MDMSLHVTGVIFGPMPLFNELGRQADAVEDEA